jgi:hypothetical protein
MADNEEEQKTAQQTTPAIQRHPATNGRLANEYGVW